jgi:hypothetical protein
MGNPGIGVRVTEVPGWPVRAKKAHQITIGAAVPFPPGRKKAYNRAGIMTGRRNRMTRIIFVIPLVAVASMASAQSGRPDPGCGRDVARHCRAVMNDGDDAVLACLKQNRARLSKTCEKVLTDNGQ